MFTKQAADLGFTQGRLYTGFVGGTGYMDVFPDNPSSYDVQKNSTITGARLHLYVTPFSFY